MLRTISRTNPGRRIKLCFTSIPASANHQLIGSSGIQLLSLCTTSNFSPVLWRTQSLAFLLDICEAIVQKITLMGTIVW